MADKFKTLHDDGTEDWLTREEMIAALDLQGGAIDPLEIGELVAAYLQAHPLAAGTVDLPPLVAALLPLLPSGLNATFHNVSIPMYQTGSLPGGTRQLLAYQDAKVVCQELYIPRVLVWTQYLVAFTQDFINTIPDIDVAVGGQFEWDLPRGHRLSHNPDEPDLRGYFTFPCGVGYADHPRTMGAVGMIRTEAPNKCIAYLRVDMFAQMIRSIMLNDKLYGEEWGALNRRRPWGKWTPGSWIKWTATYAAE